MELHRLTENKQPESGTAKGDTVPMHGPDEGSHGTVLVIGPEREIQWQVLLVWLRSTVFEVSPPSGDVVDEDNVGFSALIGVYSTDLAKHAVLKLALCQQLLIFVNGQNGYLMRLDALFLTPLQCLVHCIDVDIIQKRTAVGLQPRTPVSYIDHNDFGSLRIAIVLVGDQSHRLSNLVVLVNDRVVYDSLLVEVTNDARDGRAHAILRVQNYYRTSFLDGRHLQWGVLRINSSLVAMGRQKRWLQLL